VAVSGQLSLAVAALFFAIRYTALADWLERRLEARALTLATVVALAGYATVALGWPATFTGIAHWILVQTGAQPGYDPSTYGYGAPAAGDVTGGAGWLPFALVGLVVALYLFPPVLHLSSFSRARSPVLE